MENAASMQEHTTDSIATGTAKAKGNNVIHGAKTARTDKLMRRLGFTFTGGNYVLGMG